MGDTGQSKQAQGEDSRLGGAERAVVPGTCLLVVRGTNPTALAGWSQCRYRSQSFIVQTWVKIRNGRAVRKIHYECFVTSAVTPQANIGSK